MPKLKPADRIARAQQDQARAAEQIKRAKADLRNADRRADTRRKIILGAWLLDIASRSPATADRIEQFVGSLERAADRDAFEGFTVPRPASDAGGA